MLSGELLELQESRRTEVATRIEQLANFFLGLVGDRDPLEPIDWRVLQAFGSDAARGKALFLDIMGFASEAVMAGTPTQPDIETVVRSYGGRLRPRHHALARLAREGLAPAMVTTNYDLLLEGAYRLAGFVDRESGGNPEDELRSGIPRFSCIAAADQFFSRGEGHRTALLLKIHGSAGVYREVRRRRIDAIKASIATGRRRRSGDDPWAGYLTAMVFTYREIQTWRTDAWSRDLIRTLLRTHTLALCGYSGADPIMHSTFREVYEERASARGVRAGRRAASTREDAPVFFFGIADRREFYSLEILRAGSGAAGHSEQKLADHPNHIEFQIGDGVSHGGRPLPVDRPLRDSRCAAAGADHAAASPRAQDVGTPLSRCRIHGIDCSLQRATPQREPRDRIRHQRDEQDASRNPAADVRAHRRLDLAFCPWPPAGARARRVG